MDVLDASPQSKINIVIKDFHSLNFSEVVDLPVIAVYQHPKDYPDKYVARLWDMGPKATRFIVIRDTLDEIREAIPKTMVRLPPSADDDPVIVEVWV